MLTFQNQYEMAQAISGDSSATNLVYFKRFINQGIHIIDTHLNRYFSRRAQTFNIVNAQQYYQMPEDAVRMTGLVVTVNSIAYPLQEITSEEDWRYLNATTTNSANIPSFFFVRGADEFGIYPIPSAAITNGGELYYERRQKDMTQADFTTGTVTVTGGSQTVTHSAAGFTAAMVGRGFLVTDGSADGLWYRIGSYTDASNLLLDNAYGGTTGAGKSFNIGEVTLLGEDLHELPVDYAMYRFSLSRSDLNSAKEYKAIFDNGLAEAKRTYALKTSSRVIHGQRINLAPTGVYQLPNNISGGY